MWHIYQSNSNSPLLLRSVKHSNLQSSTYFFKTLFSQCSIQNRSIAIDNISNKQSQLMHDDRGKARRKWIRLIQRLENSPTYSLSRWCRCHWRCCCSSSSSSSGVRHNWSVASPPVTWSLRSPRRTHTIRRSNPPRWRTSLEQNINIPRKQQQ